ncbi:hypothetical protein MC885_012656 [Smutsia gigantea]|nr:hypothetical protein MC885_012656 [Smutsia gigantea]
MLSLGL